MPSKNRISALRWLVATIGITLALVCGVVCANLAIDPYGMIRNVQGRHIPGFGDDRVAKYLLNKKYVPANFDAIVIGSSVSSNWNTAHLQSFKVYNESLNGGNIVEEKAIVDRVLGTGRIKLAIVVLHPYLTASHEFETVHVTPHEDIGALGSLNLLDAYKERLFARLHRGEQAFDASGVYKLPEGPHEMNAPLKKLMAAEKDFPVDPVAFKAYEGLIGELHAAGIPIVFVVPPISQPLLETKATPLKNYADLMLRDRAAGDKVLDFNSTEFEAFRSDESNFSDGVHLTQKGATVLVGDVNRALQSWKM